MKRIGFKKIKRKTKLLEFSNIPNFFKKSHILSFVIPKEGKTFQVIDNFKFSIEIVIKFKLGCKLPFQLISFLVNSNST